MAWYASITRFAGRQCKVLISMARCARQPGYTIVVGATYSRRLMNVMVVALQWVVARWMAVHAPGTEKDLCDFDNIARDRASRSAI